MRLKIHNTCVPSRPWGDLLHNTGRHCFLCNCCGEYGSYVWDPLEALWLKDDRSASFGKREGHGIEGYTRMVVDGLDLLCIEVHGAADFVIVACHLVHLVAVHPDSAPWR